MKYYIYQCTECNRQFRGRSNDEEYDFNIPCHRCGASTERTEVSKEIFEELGNKD